jgi:hypothetical protein
MKEERVPVLFYGLYMDFEVLRKYADIPEVWEVARLHWLRLPHRVVELPRLDGWKASLTPSHLLESVAAIPQLWSA